MCIICQKLAEGTISYYDARLMAGEYKMMIGEKHYGDIIKALNEAEKPKPEFNTEDIDKLDYESWYPYNGVFGGSND